MAYLLDANVFIQAKNFHYGFDFCPAFWDWLDEANAKDVVFSVEKVGDELEAGDDELVDWTRERTEKLFRPPDPEIVSALGTVSNWAVDQDYEPAAVHTFLRGADYYLVAGALAHGHTVVTHEVASASKKHIKIPNVCIGLKITCVSPFQMLRRERAHFVLGKHR